MKQTGNFLKFSSKTISQASIRSPVGGVSVLGGLCPSPGSQIPVTPLPTVNKWNHLLKNGHTEVWLFMVIKILLLESSELSGLCESMLDEDLRDSVCGHRRSDSISLLNISSSAASANKACFKHTHPPKNDLYCV